MVLPIHDVNPTHRTPGVTRLLLLANVLAFVVSPIAASPLMGGGSTGSLCS